MLTSRHGIACTSARSWGKKAFSQRPGPVNRCENSFCFWKVGTSPSPCHVTHMSESCHTYEWVMSHIWMSHVTHMSESCHTYEWVTSHIWMSYITMWLVHVNESCRTHEFVMSRLAHSNESYHSYESLRHSTHMNESYHTYEWVIFLIWTSHMTHMNELYHHITRSYEWVMSHIWMRHVIFGHTYEWVMSHMWVRHVTRLSESCLAYEWVLSHIYIMGLQRLVGSIKLKVFFPEYCLFTRALLQKRPLSFYRSY